MERQEEEITVDKENVNPIERIENLKDISVDSLDPGLGSPKKEKAEAEQSQLPADKDSQQEQQKQQQENQQQQSEQLGLLMGDAADDASTTIADSPIVDESFGPALVATSSFDSPAVHTPAASSGQQRAPLVAEGDGGGDQMATSSSPMIREAEEYADDLVRELIEDSNQLVRSEHSSALEFASPQLVHLQTHQEEPHEEEEEEDKEEGDRNGGDDDKAEEESIEKQKQGQMYEFEYEEEKANNQESAASTMETAAEQRVDNSPQLNTTNKLIDMDFTKNYSDDLMGQNDGAQQGESLPSGAADLADFELPPYSGSSSSSEPRHHSPVKRKSSSSSSAAQASSSHQYSNAVAAPDLNAVKNLIMSSYSRVSHVFHWKRPIETGIIFAIGVSIIIALTFFSIISVVAYSALVVISTSGSIRIYKTIMKTLNRSSETPFDNIWNKALGSNISMSPERMHELVDSSLGNFNASLVFFKQVLLVEDKFATLKFGLFLYGLTYIGSWFNGLTLITVCYIALFSVPIFYENNKTKIDEYLNLASNQASSAISMVTNKFSSLAFGSSPAASSSGGSSSKKKN